MKTFQENDTVYIMGCNAKENWKLLDEADEDDVWVHLHDYTSAYIFIRNKTRGVSMEDIAYGGKLIQQHSKHRNRKNLKMCYLEARHVSKGKITGQAKCVKQPNIKMIKH
jgi:predicted ribosome quality control (RQC) complex YloA/Tae2 family protein